MKPEIVAQHEEEPEYEGEIVQGEGRQDVPCCGGCVEEPDKDDGGVFNEGEAVIEKVLVPSSLFFSIEKHEDVDHTKDKGE